VPEISIDANLELTDITPKFFRILKQMEPFGPLNMKPVFKTNAVRDNGYGKQVGADKSHLKLTVFQGSDRVSFGAIGFGLGNKIHKVHNEFDILYSLDENEWKGNTSIQLVLKDLK